jgi:hypothetical protein
MVREEQMIGLLLAIALAGGQGQTTIHAPTTYQCYGFTAEFCDETYPMPKKPFLILRDERLRGAPAPVTEGAKKNAGRRDAAEQEHNKAGTTWEEGNSKDLRSKAVFTSPSLSNERSAEVPVVAEGAETVKAYIKMCSGITGKCDDDAETVKPEVHACIQPNHIDPGFYPSEIVPCLPESPLIVPAVQKKRKMCVEDDPPPIFCAAISGGCPCGTHWGDEDYWTCSDSKRVLLTSEDGEYYCMRVK